MVFLFQRLQFLKALLHLELHFLHFLIRSFPQFLNFTFQHPIVLQNVIDLRLTLVVFFSQLVDPLLLFFDFPLQVLHHLLKPVHLGLGALDLPAVLGFQFVLGV